MYSSEMKNINKSTPSIGFGAWGIGGETPGATSYGPMNDEAAHACITSAYKAGTRFYDTSPAYGYGKSEERLGATLTQHRENIILATKGGILKYEDKADFSSHALNQGLDESLLRLKTHYVDIFQLHNPPMDVLSTNTGLTVWLDDLKHKGKATTVGISVKSPEDALGLLSAYPFDTVQVNYNMLDTRALECGLLDYCEKHKVSVIARTPLCFGFLSLNIDETTAFNSADHRSNWSTAQKKLWAVGARQTQKIAAQHDTVNASATARALRFCLCHPAVRIVLTGPLTSEEATENAGTANLPPLLSTCLEAIKALHKHHSFYENTS